MAYVTVRKGETEFEIHDLTFEQVKELVGVNGYGHTVATSAPAATSSAEQGHLPLRDDMPGFIQSISDRGRNFLDILKQHPDGIEANALAARLGFQDARQIGGLTGGGLAKTAKKHGVKLEHVYRVATTFPDGKRMVVFYPGRLLKEKPAV